MTETPTTETVALAGERFHIAERIGGLPIMRFAKAARQGVDSDDMAGMAALYDLLEQCIHPDDWARFEAHADRERADGEQLVQVVAEVLQLVAARPTGRSSDSSAGPPTTGPSSTGRSSERVIRRYEDKGRPDLALMVLKRQESLDA